MKKLIPDPPIPPFPCYYCDRGFDNPSRLRNHLYSQHRKEMGLANPGITIKVNA